MEKEYSKISPTAVFCARMRAKQKLPFSKEIVTLIDTKFRDLVEDLPDYGNTLNSKSDFIPFIEGRYYSLNDALSKIGNAFIVEIASGLSPRSLEFLNKKDITYIETELEGLINLKEKILNEIITQKKLDAKNLFFMDINPLKRKDMDKIGKLYLEKGKNKKLIIIHEGLLMYLDKNEKRVFKDNLKYLFEKYSKEGLWLTSDFSRMKKKKDEVLGKENIREKISKVTKRKFDYFESEEETKKFLRDGGFALEILSNEKVISNLIEKKSLQFNKDPILNSSKGYKIWKMILS
jgi:O-methyltransferase involved in polyketide biosynthesis